VQRPTPADTLAVTTARADFRDLAAGHRVVPVTRKVLADSETPLSAYRKLAANRPGTFLLESAENGRSWSRWSFIGAGAPSALTVRDGEAVWLGTTPQGAPSGGDPLAALRTTLDLLATAALPGLPPLSSGLVGFFAYDRCGGWNGYPSTPPTTSACRTCCCCWPPISPPSTTTRAPSP
jgi:anthranilate synthase component 1